MSSEEDLKNKIKELEQEVSDRERDLGQFRKELAAANKKLEGLIVSLSHQLKVAHRIQKVLVPTELPNIPGFEFSSKFVPSYKSGGDYFDIFEHDDRARFGVIVASSSGHSMSALLLSVLLKLTGQMEARKGAEPHKVIQLIAEEITPSIEGEDQADLFYGLVDRRNFELSYCRAGDVIALSQDYSSGELKLLKPSVTALNKDFHPPITSEVISLNPRDRVIICTPGIVQTQNLEGEEFGQERLFKAILEGERQGVHKLRNHILYEVQKYSGGQEPLRDQTLMVVEVKDRVIKLAKS